MKFASYFFSYCFLYQGIGVLLGNPMNKFYAFASCVVTSIFLIRYGNELSSKGDEGND